jgi:hypothetical protein
MEQKVRRMKILLQHTGSRLFYKSTGVWVQEEMEARPFISALEAIEYCEKQGLTSLEIVLRPSSGGDELRVGPVPLPTAERRYQTPPT